MVGIAFLLYTTEFGMNRPTNDDVQIVNVDADLSMYSFTDEVTFDFTIINKADATAFVEVAWTFHDDNYNPPNQYQSKMYTVFAGSEKSFTETITFTSNTDTFGGPQIVGTVEFSGY